MKRTSAIAVAAGLAGSLVSGLIGYSMRLTGLRSAQAAPAPPATQSPPIVKTITTTVKVHKKPKVHAAVSSGGAGVTYVSAPPVTTAPPVGKTSGSHSGGDDGQEHGGGDD
jgi:hypothetical protein